MPRWIERIWAADPSVPGPRRERQSLRYQAFVPDPIARLQLALPAQAVTVVSAAERLADAFNPGRADFVPPPPESVPALMDDLCAFVNRADLPAVVQAAVAHAQFETIHPFADGNGRVGRALIHVVLRRRGLAPRYVPPVSL